MGERKPNPIRDQLSEVRSAIAGDFPVEPGQILAGEIRAEKLMQMIERTGQPRKVLVDLWDQTYDSEARLSLTFGVQCDVSAISTRFVWHLLNLTAQHEEIRHEERERWEHQELSSIFTQPRHIPDLEDFEDDEDA